MIVRRLLIAIGLVLMAGTFAPPAGAGVVVLTNRADVKVSYILLQPDGRQIPQELAHDDVASLPTPDGVKVVFAGDGQSRRYLLRANGIYYFHADGKKLEILQQPIPGLLALPADSASLRPAGAPSLQPAADQQDFTVTFPVKLLVDDKEPRVRGLWEKEYRDRIAAASAIIQRHCRVRFKVEAIGVWTSDDNVHSFPELVADFERKVRPAQGQLAIGFTGQFKTLREDQRMGGSLGPFRSHIMIREWGQQITEPERLEILVHELGHFSAPSIRPSRNPSCVPISAIGNRGRSFRIRFDAPNTLILSLLSEEYHRRSLAHLGQLPPSAKSQLRPIYQALAAALPSDPAAPRYLSMLNQPLLQAGEAKSPLDHAWGRVRNSEP